MLRTLRVIIGRKLDFVGILDVLNLKIPGILQNNLEKQQKMGVFTKNPVLTKSILFFRCHSKRIIVDN